MGLFSKKEKKETLDQGLNKTKESFFSKLSRSILGKSTVDDSVLDNLEETLISSDVGVETTLKIIDKLQERIKRDKYISTSELNSILRAEIATLLRKHDGLFPEDFDAPLAHKPYVILVVGVNGVGKTTTIAKLAYQYKQAGKTVMLGAADTFRAAAVEQLQLWADRHPPVSTLKGHRRGAYRHRRTPPQQSRAHERTGQDKESHAETHARRTPRDTPRA